MAFGIKQSSRTKGNPVKLFLIKGSDPALESMMRSASIGPGMSEFGFGTTRVHTNVTATQHTGTQVSIEQPQNFISGQPNTDFFNSINDLLAAAPLLNHVTLQVAWHGEDLRLGYCRIRPRVEQRVLDTIPYHWRSGELLRSEAHLLSSVNGVRTLSGAPCDRSIFEAIRYLKGRGLAVTLYPIVLMDIPSNNTLPDPYGDSRQGAYPSQSRITCYPGEGQPGSPQFTNMVDIQIASFFGTSIPEQFSWNAAERRVVYRGPDKWRYSRFIMHMATIAKAAGADDFLIGGNLGGITSLVNGDKVFPAVAHLRDIAIRSRSILGKAVNISYAADWTEYGGRLINGDFRFPLDALWAHSAISYVAINNYMPLADWRSGYSHADWRAGFTSGHDIEYLKSNVEGGQFYDWNYISPAKRAAQNRTPIKDSPAYNEDWIWRRKDIRNWWRNAHHERFDGVRRATSTPWVPRSKRIVFTELACAAIDKAANQPDAIYDPTSSQNGVPFASNRRPDVAIQRAYLEAMLAYWNEANNGMLDMSRISVGMWDIRPYPTFPRETAVYPDSARWLRGHWLTGRLMPGRAVENNTFGPYAFTNGEHEITRAGVVYRPWPIKHSDIQISGTLDKSDLTITMATGSGLESEFVGFPPSQVINLTIFQGHMDDTPTMVDYPAQWMGRIIAPEFKDNEVSFNCTPVSSSIQRPGLRRNYQLSCPHVLYGPSCRANKRRATVARTVIGVNRNRITLAQAVGSTPAGTAFRPGAYVGGLIEWTSDEGRKEARTIVNLTPEGETIFIRGTNRGLAVGSRVLLSYGCRRTMADCQDLHFNILNFGGQPFIPLENPLSQKNHFY